MASEWTVVLGRLKQNGSNPFEVTLNVTNITTSNVTGPNVAVLRLATQPTLSDYIQIICLDNGHVFSVGSTCFAAGWSAGRGGGESMPHSHCSYKRFLPPGSDSDTSLLIISFFLPTLVEQDLQEFQTSVVNCGNKTTNESICTNFLTLEQVSNEARPSFGSVLKY